MATAYSFASCVPVVSDSSLSLSFFRSIRCGRLVPGMSLATSPSGLRCYGSHGASDATVTDRKHFTQLPLWQRFRGFVELTRKPIFPRTLFFHSARAKVGMLTERGFSIYIYYIIYIVIYSPAAYISPENCFSIFWHLATRRKLYDMTVLPFVSYHRWTHGIKFSP